MVLAGGRGTRMMPLTQDRAKPGVPFGGRYRLIDFVLSNLVNSGFYRIVVLTQYKSQSLSQHISRAWRLSRPLDHFVEPVPAQQRTGTDWYRGSADAIYQNLNLIDDHAPDDVGVFGADHVYKMDVSSMLHEHRDARAALTIAAIPVPVAEAREFGVIAVDAQWRMTGFMEKPSTPPEMPGRPGWALASMGNYFFTRRALEHWVSRDADLASSAHDFGRDVIPAMLEAGEHIQVYDFSGNRVPGQPEREVGYWRDVGSVASYYDAHMDLVAVLPVLDLYNRSWPIRTDYSHLAPAKFVHSSRSDDRVGMATESLVSEGCIISGGRIHRSVLGPNVRVNSYSLVSDSVLFENVVVGRSAELRKAIVDKNVEIGSGVRIGVDHGLDRARGCAVTPEGIVVVPKGSRILS
jgi:glucose-1-phosphate adenylyltransferase